MSTKQIKGVIVPRHDIAKNWANAVNFIPRKGELIVFDADTETYDFTVTINGTDCRIKSSDKVRFKFGDGEPNAAGELVGTNVNALPFATSIPDDYNTDYVDNTFANALKLSVEGKKLTITDASPVTHDLKVKLRGGKNLFNQDLWTKQGFVKQDDGSYLHNSDNTLSINSTISCPLPAGIYTLTAYIKCNADKNYTPIVYYEDGTSGYKSLPSDNEYKRIEFTTNGKPIREIGFNYAHGDTNIQFKDWQIEESPVATDYEPYVTLQDVTVTRRCDNLIPIADWDRKEHGSVEIINNKDGSYTINGQNGDGNIAFEIASVNLEKGKTYTLSGCMGGNNTTKYQLIAVHGNIINLYNPTTPTPPNMGYQTKEAFGSGSVSVSFYIYSGYKAENLVIRPQLEISDTVNEPQTATANADGIVDGLTSIPQTMILETNNPFVAIECEYNKDITAAFENTVGKKTSAGGEIFNNYEDLIKDGEIKVAKNIAGMHGFRILTSTFSTSGDIATLTCEIEDNTSGLEIDDVVSLRLSWNHVDIGKISDITDTTVIITLNGSADTHDATQFEIKPDQDLYPWYNTLVVNKKPDIGNIVVGKYSHAEGLSNKAYRVASHAEGWKNVIYGDFGHAEGVKNTAHYAAHAEGTMGNALGSYSHTEGVNNTATGEAAHAEGYDTVKAIGKGSHAEGHITTASGDYSHAEGNTTTASGVSSHSEGESTTASGQDAHAEGGGTTASGKYSHAEGYATSATKDASHAEGKSTTASGNYSHAEGQGTLAEGVTAHAEGNNTQAKGPYSHAEGNTTYATVDCAHAEGSLTHATGAKSHAEGNGTTASGGAAHSEGQSTTASGDYSHAEGLNTKATKPYSHAECNQTEASGTGAHAEGYLAVAKGSYSHAEGIRTSSESDGTHAEGQSTVARGLGAHAEGYGTAATVEAAHAEGRSTTASGVNSHAEGLNTKATGPYSHAEGNQTEASVDSAHAEGSLTKAQGAKSHAEGYSTTAKGVASHSEGFSTIASTDYQHVEGKYNKEEPDALHIIGNGSGPDNRTNAFVVYKDGHAEVQNQGLTNNSVVTTKYMHDFISDSVTSTYSNFHELSECVSAPIQQLSIIPYHNYYSSAISETYDQYGLTLSPSSTGLNINGITDVSNESYIAISWPANYSAGTYRISCEVDYNGIWLSEGKISVRSNFSGWPVKGETAFGATNEFTITEDEELYYQAACVYLHVSTGYKFAATIRVTITKINDEIDGVTLTVYNTPSADGMRQSVSIMGPFTDGDSILVKDNKVKTTIKGTVTDVTNTDYGRKLLNLYTYSPNTYISCSSCKVQVTYNVPSLPNFLSRYITCGTMPPAENTAIDDACKIYIQYKE